MAFDGIVLANLTYELNKNLLNSRVSKISMPNNDELVFNIKGLSSNHKLLICASPSLPLMYLCNETKKNPLNAPSFCMLLRKHIGNAKIIGLEQLGLERIVCITFEGLNELGDLNRKKLYIELMGKYSNIIFTDEDDIIIDSIKRISANISSLREVLPNKRYFIPSELIKNDLLNISYDEFYNIISNSKDSIANTIYKRFSGISPLIADEICLLSSTNTQRACSDLNNIEITHIYHTIMNMMDDIKNKAFIPNIIYKDGIPIEFSSIKINAYSGEDYVIKEYSSISNLLYDYYSQKEKYVRIRQKSSDIRKVISSAFERANKKFILQEKQLKDSQKKEKYKIYADLLNTYGYSLKGGEKEFICQNYYDNNNEITIPLDENLSATENAKKYYDKYAKLGRTKKALEMEIEKTKADIEHLSSIIVSIDIAMTENDLSQIKEELAEYGYIKKIISKRKEKIISQPLHYISSDGFHIYVGKNNYQNEEITFKLAANNDWWFHAKGIPGSHVVLKAENRELTDRAYEEAASLAAYYSKARENDKVEVDYLQRKQLKKVTGAAPGFVIYHTNWSLICTPNNTLELIP